jgi:hypothetical protein
LVIGFIALSHVLILIDKLYIQVFMDTNPEDEPVRRHHLKKLALGYGALEHAKIFDFFLLGEEATVPSRQQLAPLLVQFEAALKLADAHVMQHPNGGDSTSCTAEKVS